MRPLLICLAALFALPASAQDNGIEPAPLMDVTVENIADGGPIPMKHALCEATPEGKSTDGENLRPTISWSGAPKEAKSFVVIVKDPDVPADFADAGKDGKVVAKDAKRQLFYHWALADIPATFSSVTGGKSEEAPNFGTKATNSLGSYIKDAHNYGGPARPGTTNACTAISSPCMRWMCRR